MDSIIFHCLAYVVAFIFLWFGSGLLLESITKISKYWKLSTFSVSFFVLGLATSLPEVSIGFSAILSEDPAIYAGNLLGAMIVIFFCVIPLLGILSGGVKIPQQLDRKRMVMILLTVIYPAFATADQKITIWEGIFSVILYLGLFVFFSIKKQSVLERFIKKIKTKKEKKRWIFLKMLIGIVCLLGAGQQVVNSTMFFANYFEISPFIISLLVVALGTNIPELSIIVRSLLNHKSEIALADYLGSASANTLLFGIFTIANGQTVQLPNHFIQRFLFLGIGLVLFSIFSKSNKKLSIKESLLLFGLYLCFVIYELTSVVN